MDDRPLSKVELLDRLVQAQRYVERTLHGASPDEIPRKLLKLAMYWMLVVGPLLSWILEALRRRRLPKPPGWRLADFSRFVFSRRTYTVVLEPTLRDLLDEYLAALAEGQPRKATWVRWRGYFAFWSAVVNQLPVSFLRLLVKLWKAAGI